MDPNAWQAYQQAYSRFGSNSREAEANPYTSNPAFLLAHQQLREAATQHYQAQQNLLPPSLVQAAAVNKNHLHQQALANLNMRESVMSSSSGSGSNPLLTPPVTPVSTSWSKASNSQGRAEDQPRRSVIETKTAQPAFPGQPPPLTDSRLGRSLESPNSQPAFPGQPPPRQSSQPRSTQSSQPAFPGLPPGPSQYAQEQSPVYGNNYSPQAQSPQGYHNVNSPQDYHAQMREERERQRREQEMEEERKRQEEKERQERHRINEHRREQERIRQEQERQREQERIRQEQEKIREQERIKKEQEERRRRQEQERRREQERIRLEHERRKREEEQRRREEAERQKLKEQERLRQEQERLRQEQDKIRKEQERAKLEAERARQEQERLEQQKLQEEQRDLGLARLSAMGALNDLESDSNNYHYEQSAVDQQQTFQTPINFHELNMFNQNRQTMQIKQEQEQKPIINNQYNTWINRANELLDLSSSDSRETPNTTAEGEQSGFIPQILMNPWDPQQAPMMTLAPIANAMQQYQQQWLTQYQQATQGMLGQGEEESEASYSLGKFRVLCISPDEEMGFLINLPAPCNLLYQQTPEGVGLVLKNVSSPFLTAYQKYLEDPEGATKNNNLTEAPDKPPPLPLPGKKAYVPPYTPKATNTRPDCKVSSSGLSRSLVIEPVKKAMSSTNRHSSSSNTSSRSRSSSQAKEGTTSDVVKNKDSLRNHLRKVKNKNHMEDDDETPSSNELPKRELSRRKAKEQASSKRKAQDDLLLDADDPTFNNPALDLEDSDEDGEWTPAKEAEGKGRSKKYRGDSSDEDEFDGFSSNKSNFKKRAFPDLDRSPKKRLSTENNLEAAAIVPEGDSFKVGDFIILKTETSNLKASIWKVDGKTLIQKYDPVDEEEGNQYKNVNTYSGWTAATRHRYEAINVKVLKSSAKETLVERLKSDEMPDKIHTETNRSDKPATPTKPKPINLEEIREKSWSETKQFQENFEVYMQTLISQCLDSNFLNEIFSESDEYFVGNIEKVDSVTLLRKDKLLAGITWTLRFQKALTVWPCLSDLGSDGPANGEKCGACEKETSHTQLQLFGQPYNNNTLATIPPTQEAKTNRSFFVCTECCRLCSLYHKLAHQKQKLYMMCSEIVEGRKVDSPGIDTTQILNQLLADDQWLEGQFKKMQQLWSDADCFVK